MQKKINKLFNEKEIQLFKLLIGQKLEKVRHDRFDFSNTSYRRVTLFVDDKAYELINDIEETDFMWDDYGDEAIAVFKFEKTNDMGIDYNYGIENYPKQIENPVNEIIKDIIIIEDNVKAFDKATNSFVSEYDYVKGIIVVLDGFSYCFTRDVWFSEEIRINKGENPQSKIGNIDDDWEWGEDRYSINSRTFKSLK